MPGIMWVVVALLGPFLLLIGLLLLWAGNPK